MIDPVQVSETALNIVPMDHPLGSRVSVIGGGGKSTLAKALAARTGLTYIELDALHWKPNWVESTAAELADKVNAAIAAAPGGWIADGSYLLKIGDLVLGKADTVIWLDLPWRVMFWRMLKRSFQRAWDKNKICGDNTESWRLMFSKDALWLYWITHRRKLTHKGDELRELLPAEKPVIRLTSAGELNRFYRLHRIVRAN